MSGYGYGKGYHIGPVGGPASTAPTPGELSDMVVWLSADGSFPTAEDNHTPGTPYHLTGTQTLTNLATGGPALTFDSALASGRPYYHTANWAMDTGESNGFTISAPNSEAFMASNKPSDSGLTTCPQHRINFTATTDQIAYSGISIMYFESRSIERRMWENIGGGGSYGRNGQSEDSYGEVHDGTASTQIVQNYAPDRIHREWIIYIWRHAAAGDSSPGVTCAWNGYRPVMTALAANIDNATRYNCFMPYTQYTTAWTDHVLYEAAHTLADLDVVAADFATKYGITYTVESE